MPNRIIKESICTSESLSKISAQAERLFMRLIVKADDFGLYYGNTKIIMGNCFPLIKIKESDLEKWLGELEKENIISFYKAEDGKIYLKLNSWDENQTRRATKSKFPLPHAFESNCMQANANVSVNENVNENVNEERERSSCAKAQAREAFEKFWEAYPKKRSKGDAEKAFEQLNVHKSSELLTKMLSALERAKTCDQWTRDNGQYIPYPGTWIRAKGWEDDYSENQAKPAAKGAAQKNYKDQREYTDSFFDSLEKKVGV